MSHTQSNSKKVITVHGIKVETLVAGRGRPLLFLHPGLGLFGADTFLAHLGGSYQVIAPSHPGFGHSELPDWMSNIDDLSYFYLDFLDELDLHDAVIIGASFGGWIAAEIAVKSTARLTHLVFMSTLGIKVSGPEQRDIADIYGLPRADIDRRSFKNPSRKPSLAEMSDEELRVVARNREAEALFGWSPYMHNPKLKGRLHRIRIPTLVLWGAEDAVATPEYGRAFAASIPEAGFKLVDGAGHYPHIEEPLDSARAIFDFVQADTRVRASA